MTAPIRLALADTTPALVRVRRLTLAPFRNHALSALEIARPLVTLSGENGAGKTNILEALSLFCAGRGLRRAALDEIVPEGAAPLWAVNMQLDGPLGEVNLGTGLQGEGARACRIDGVPVPSASAFAEHLRVVWLTPAMDGLFNGSGGERRRFLDRMVLAVDPTHGTRVAAMEKALRSRNRLLEDGYADPAWLDALERELAELAVAVAAARADLVARLSALIALHQGEAFPWAHLALDGDLERAVLAEPATSVEDRYRAALRDNRYKDRAAGRTLIGPHLSDLLVRHGPTDVAAARASTGQQKALLVGLVLAHARLVASLAGFPPLVLLDEVAAHLDPTKRAALYAELETLGAQVWLTGADPAAFEELSGRADRFAVAEGRVTPLT